MSTTIVAMADTHGEHDRIDVPDGDILIHAGDFTQFGEHRDDFLQWFKDQPHEHKALIMGNHESMGMTRFALDEFEQQLRSDEALSYVGIVPKRVGGLMVGGQTEGELDIMVTHRPPQGILDNEKGDPTFRRTVDSVRPRLHVFGHIHEARGRTMIGETQYANVAVTDSEYELQHDPMVTKLS